MTAKKKPRVTPEDVARDPSLKYFPQYRKWEVLWSEQLQKHVRFVSSEGEMVTVAELNSCRDYPEPLPLAGLWRPRTY